MSLPADAAVNVSELVYRYTNDVRRQNRRRPFARSGKLERAAAGYAKVLARTGVFSHTADGTTLKHRVKKQGYRGGYMAENVAYRPVNLPADALARKFVTDWLNSRGHRRNLLHPKLVEIGCGTAVANNRIYAVQVFGGY